MICNAGRHAVERSERPTDRGPVRWCTACNSLLLFGGVQFLLIVLLFFSYRRPTALRAARCCTENHSLVPKRLTFLHLLAFSLRRTERR